MVGHLNEGLSEEAELGKEDVDRNTGNFQADKKLGKITGGSRSQRHSRPNLS